MTMGGHPQLSIHPARRDPSACALVGRRARGAPRVPELRPPPCRPHRSRRTPYACRGTPPAQPPLVANRGAVRGRVRPSVPCRRRRLHGQLPTHLAEHANVLDGDPAAEARGLRQVDARRPRVPARLRRARSPRPAAPRPDAGSLRPSTVPLFLVTLWHSGREGANPIPYLPDKRPRPPLRAAPSGPNTKQASAPEAHNIYFVSSDRRFRLFCTSEPRQPRLI